MGSGASKTPNVKPKMTSSTYDVTVKKTEEEKMAEKHEMNVSNMYMLKRMFKQLDPVVMNSNGGVQGKVNVSIKYITEKSLLLVKIISARDLLTKDVRGASANPYIKVEMHSNENMEERSTSVKQNTCNPIYNEVFMFPLSIEESTKLRLSVWCHDALGEDDFMGEHVINVSELDCSDVITNKWLSLHPETDFSISGKIKISMTYQSPQSLFIAVNDVTELRCKSQKPQISIRVYIPGVPYVFETKPASDVKMGDDVSADDVVSC
uniref:C2 domain-containing protein n=1 Tax=Ciona savignyi TaxID=51511 RepID=H2Z8S2_CIOSA